MQAANFLAGDRRSQTVNHNKAVSEALQSLSWVMYSGPSCGEYAAVKNGILSLQGITLIEGLQAIRISCHRDRTVSL